MFSHPATARHIARHFEPAWETVRSVPMVRIDFGGGHVITRTFHGNIATYICNAEGAVMDVIPGLYDPGAYTARLDQARLLMRYVGQREELAQNQARPDADAGDRGAAKLADYHKRQAEAMEKNESPFVLVAQRDVNKAGIEYITHVMLVGGKDLAKVPPHYRPRERPHYGDGEDVPRLSAAGDSADWKALAEDTKQNETARRLAIHKILAEKAGAKPSDLTKRLYKDVLNADLDDPYLGLGKILFANYPFEDGKNSGR